MPPDPNPDFISAHPTRRYRVLVDICVLLINSVSFHLEKDTIIECDENMKNYISGYGNCNGFGVVLSEAGNGASL